MNWDMHSLRNCKLTQQKSKLSMKKIIIPEVRTFFHGSLQGADPRHAGGTENHDFLHF